MKIVPMFGNGVAGHSYPVTRQRRVNCYMETREDGDKTKVAIFGTPGLVSQFDTTAVVRGMFGTESYLYTAQGAFFRWYNSAGVQLGSAAIGTSSNNVSMTIDNDQLLLVDGASAYTFNLASSLFAVITSTGFPFGAQTCTMVGGYFVVEQPGTQYFWVSDPYDATTWNGLAFASASQYPDRIQAVDALSGNLVVFSERHIEFWQNIGNQPQPFAPILSATSEFGIQAIWSRAHIGNSILFLSQNPQGTSQVVALTGYNAQVISTADIEQIIGTFGYVGNAVALSYVTNGHSMYQLTFPNANRSFLYDLTSGIWSEVQSGIATGYAQRHIGQFATTLANNAVVSDYAAAKIYSLSETTYTDNGQTVLREVVTRHGVADHNVFGLSELYLDMETGVGLQSGQGSDPMITLEVSKDNGRTWSNPRMLSMGQIGQYSTRVIARRFGSSRDFVFRFRLTDPVKFVITDGAAAYSARPQ
jgi:hypothetical protein